MDWIMVDKCEILSPRLIYKWSPLVDKENRTLMFHSFAPATLQHIHTGDLFARLPQSESPLNSREMLFYHNFPLLGCLRLCPSGACPAQGALCHLGWPHFCFTVLRSEFRSGGCDKPTVLKVHE